MELVITIVKDYRKVETILLGFVELDITGATVIEGQGMGQLIGDVPIMADLRGLFPGSAHDSYIILSAMKSEKVSSCMELVENTCGPMDLPSAGIVFSIPIGTLRGMKHHLD